MQLYYIFTVAIAFSYIMKLYELMQSLLRLLVSGLTSRLRRPLTTFA